MRVFLDTNVIASALGTRGLCADVFRLILAEHELLTSEVVIEELARVLKRKFQLPAETINEIESFLRSYRVRPKTDALLNLPLRDRNDLAIVSSAHAAAAEILVTGDKELLDLNEAPAGLRIASPREFWRMAVRRKEGKER